MDFLSNYTVNVDSKRLVVVFQENPPGENVRGAHSEAWWRKQFEEFRSAQVRWRNYAEAVEHEIETSHEVANAGPDDLHTLKVFADFQAQEAQRLFLRLERYASDQAVPRHWR